MSVSTQDELLQAIAKQVLGFETLKTRNSDELDFRDVAVWRIREALEQAYAAGERATAQDT